MSKAELDHSIGQAATSAATARRRGGLVLLVTGSILLREGVIRR